MFDQNLNPHSIQKIRWCVYYIFAYYSFDKQMEVQKKSYLCAVYNNSNLSDVHNII